MLNFIVNLKSGRGLGKKNLQKIVKYCKTKGVEHVVHVTNAVGHATQSARDLSLDPKNVIVAVGGDGTFHEVINGIECPKNTTLGFIPSGRGNDFALGIGIPSKIERALDIILKGEIDYFDYIQIGEKRCLNVGGTGLDIDVLQRVDGRQG